MRTHAALAWRLLLLLIAVGVWLAVVVAPAWDAPAYDLSALIVGAKVVDQGDKQNLYDHSATWYNLADSNTFRQASDALGFHQVPTPFVHWPLVAALGRPFARMPFETTARVWLAVSTLAMWCGLLFALRLYAPSWLRAPTLGLTLLVLAAFEPIRYALWLGQTTPVVFALTLLALHLARMGKPLRAGFILAIPAFLKLTPMIFGLVWLARRRTRATLALVIGFAILTISSIVSMGVEAHFTYARRIAEIGAHTLVAYNNHSLSAVLSRPFQEAIECTQWRIVPQVPWARPCAAVAALVISSTAVLVLRSKQPLDGAVKDDLVEGLSMVAMLLLPSISWTHYFVFLVPLLLIVVRHAKRYLRHGRVASVVAVALFLLCMRPVLPNQMTFAPGTGLVEGPTLSAFGFLGLMCTLAVAIARPTRNVQKTATNARISTPHGSDLER
jgi:alpha-1,2-mannosyltransferase